MIRNFFSSVILMGLFVLSGLSAATAQTTPPASPPVAATDPAKPGDGKPAPATPPKNSDTGATAPKITCDATSAQALTERCKEIEKRDVPLGYGAMIVLLLFYAIAFGFTFWRLALSEKWKLSDALSEKLPQKTATPAADGGSASPTTAAVDAPSSSRLIGFLGSLVLMGVFIVGSLYIAWGLFTGEPLDRLEKFNNFLYAGAAMFMPYAANKLAEVLKK